MEARRGDRMVNITSCPVQATSFNKDENDPQDCLKWCSVPVSEVILQNKRLDASAYNIEAKAARELLKKCKFDVVTLCGENSLAKAFHFSRFRRIWVEESDYPIYQPSQIKEIYPKPSGFISEITDTDINALRVHKNQILLTCSGTIGKCTVVTATLDKKIFSHDLIRIVCNNPEDVGYVYAYLCTDIGTKLLTTNNYGAVIKHIEPDHLNNIQIPNPPNDLKKEINKLIVKSFELRDKSNQLIDTAESLLIKELKLPKLKELVSELSHKEENVKNYHIKLSELNNRLDVSYHDQTAKKILEHLKLTAEEIIELGNKKLSEKIILAGVFKRVYVQETEGIPFLGGRDILQLSPDVQKFLSIAYHKNLYEKELKVERNMILITDRGTIGNVMLAPKHFEGWAVSQNVIKLKATSDDVSGYLYIFLSSPYGKKLLKRETYGSVVNMIDDKNVSSIPIPMLKNKSIQKEINDLALKANKLRYAAYKLEQKAIKKVNNEIILNLDKKVLNNI